MRKEKICAVCKQPYKYCPHCNEDKNKPTWYFTFCSSTCKDIYDATSSFEQGKISADEAKIALDKLDLSKIVEDTSYASSVKKINDEVKNNKKKVGASETEDIVTTKKVVTPTKNFRKAKETKANVE